jgi:hypothetical protein
MTRRDDMDRLLGSWFDAEASAEGAAALLDATLADTARLRPRPAWLATIDDARPARLLPVDGRTRRRLGYAALLAAAIAALVAGAVLLSGQRPPQLSRPLACVGEPATLCGHTAGSWTSQAFLPGMTLTFPTDAWYARELPDRLELKTMPMTSFVELKLDAVPRGTVWDPAPDRSGTLESLATWIERDPELVVDQRMDRTTNAGLPVTTFHLHPVDRRACAFVFAPRDDPAGHASVLDLCHYAYRLHLVDLSDGRTMTVLLTALDAQGQTLETLDRGSWPIVDSIQPPISTAP